MQKYKVLVLKDKLNQDVAISIQDNHIYKYSAKVGESIVGMNAASVLLSSFGTCLMTNINNFSNKMDVKIEVVNENFFFKNKRS